MELLPDCNIHPEVLANYLELQNLRRTFHEQPEILYDLPITRSVILSFLSALNIDIIPIVGQSGIVAQIINPGPCILLRADMDALCITETTSHSYVSKIPGKMHACGHDGHMSMLLIAAKVLSEQKSSLKGSVKFVFQPAEEGGHGSKAMITDTENPVLKNPEVDEVYGIHISNSIQLGSFIASPKYASCNSDYFKITVIGKGGHASAPYSTKDPIIAGTHLVMALQTIVSRNIEPYYQAVLSVTMIHSGEVFNAIPETCCINGTIRTFENGVKERIQQRILELCCGIENGFECQVKCEFTHYYNPTINDPNCVEKSVKAFKSVCPKSVNREIPPMIAEDFYCFTDEKPGCFLMLGTGTEERDVPLHSGNFDFDERGMLIGASYWVELIKQLLN